MRVGDFVRVYAPRDLYAEIDGKIRRSITLWDDEYLTYKNGKFPNKSITRDDLMVVLQKKVAPVRTSVVPIRNAMVKVLTSKGEIGWILEENLEIVP